MILRSWLVSWFVLALVSPDAVLAEGTAETPVVSEAAPVPVCDPDDPTRCSVPLKTGQQAPFDGQLLAPGLALDLGQRAELADLRLDLELKRATGLLIAELALGKRLRENDREAFDAQIDLLTNRLEDAHQRIWYREPIFVATVTVVLTVLVFVCSTEALKAM